MIPKCRKWCVSVDHPITGYAVYSVVAPTRILARLNFNHENPMLSLYVSSIWPDRKNPTRKETKP